MSERVCPNCQSVLTGRFCAACGQEDYGHEPHLRELAADVWSNIFSVDGRLITTLKAMIRAPGQLTVDYFEGKRARYVTPFKLYLTCSAAYFLVARFTDLNVKIQQNGKLIQASKLSDPTAKAFVDVIREGQNYFYAHLATILILGVPFTALAAALMFLGRKRSLLYHLVFVLHVWSAVFLVGALVSVTRIPINFFQISLLSCAVYGGWASVRVYKTNRMEAIVKGVFFGLASLMVTVIALVAIMVTFAVQKKKDGQSILPPTQTQQGAIKNLGMTSP